MEIGGAGLHCMIEDVVAAFESGGCLFPAAICFAPFAEAQHNTLFLRAGRLIADPANNRVQQFTESGCRNFEPPPKEGTLYLIRWRLKADRRLPVYPVQTDVEEDQ